MLGLATAVLLVLAGLAKLDDLSAVADTLSATLGLTLNTAHVRIIAIGELLIGLVAAATFYSRWTMLGLLGVAIIFLTIRLTVPANTSSATCGCFGVTANGANRLLSSLALIVLALFVVSGAPAISTAFSSSLLACFSSNNTGSGVRP